MVVMGMTMVPMFLMLRVVLVVELGMPAGMVMGCDGDGKQGQFG